jgi:hypothetical protein
MRALARQIASGESAALTRLENLHAELYRDLNYQRDTERVRANLVLMRAAFDQLGADAGAGNPNAFAALQQALDTGLRSHVPDSLGIAAAAGHAEALDLLLEYNQHGILFSSAVFALGKPAAKNNEKAVAFLADVLADPKHRALSHAASQGLIPAAQAGNPRARAALDAYAAREPK